MKHSPSAQPLKDYLDYSHQMKRSLVRRILT